MSFRTFRRGFTLVELLVVIAVIALLISILMPALQKARRAALVTQCANNLRQYALGLQMYASRDKRSVYPPFDAGLWANFQTVWASSGTQFTKYFPHKDSYLTMYKELICGGTMKIMWCPLDNYFYNPGSDFVPTGLIDPKWPLLWYDPRFGYEKYMGGYLIFAAAEGLPSTAWANSGNIRRDRPPRRPGPSQDAILCDVRISSGGPSPWGFEYQDYHGPGDYVTAIPDEALRMRMKRENNVAYADSHVETHTGGKLAGGFLIWDSARWVNFYGIDGARAMY